MKHPVLNRLVTNEYLVRFSHLLSEGANGLPGLGGAGVRRAARNRAALEDFRAGGLIHGQGREPVARLPYGNYTMDYNGCEVIAAYNALRLLDRPMPLVRVAERFERKGIFLAGRWGTHVSAIPGFFRDLGFHTETLYASAVKSPDGYDALLDRSDAAVFSFWNSAEDLGRGVHTVAAYRRKSGETCICNLGSHDTEERRYASLARFIRDTGILPILLTGLRK